MFKSNLIGNYLFYIFYEELSDAKAFIVSPPLLRVATRPPALLPGCPLLLSLDVFWASTVTARAGVRFDDVSCPRLRCRSVSPTGCCL